MAGPSFNYIASILAVPPLYGAALGILLHCSYVGVSRGQDTLKMKANIYRCNSAMQMWPINLTRQTLKALYLVTSYKYLMFLSIWGSTIAQFKQFRSGQLFKY